MLVVEFLAQAEFLGLAPLQLRALIGPYEVIAQGQRQHQEGQAHRAGAERHRPGPRIARIERPQFVEQVHCRAPAPSRLALRILARRAAAAPSSPAVLTASAVSVKFEPVPVPLVVCTTSSSGLRSHCEPSMLRMKEETRVLDCATPSNLSRLAVCLTEVRYPPSGSVRTISSNTCTISGRERCSFSMISMRAMNFCLELSRSVISWICLSSVLISVRSMSLRCCCAWRS